MSRFWQRVKMPNICSCDSTTVEENEQEEDAPIERIYHIDENLEKVLERNLKTKDVLEDIYSVCIYTIENFIGAPREAYNEKPSELLNYINEIFPFTCDERNTVQEKIKSMGNLPLLITIDLIDAIGLECSGPYCEVWITENPTNKYRNGVDNSVNPVWNESFIIPVMKLQENLLHIDIRHEDPKQNAATVRQSKSIQNFQKFLRCCCGIKDNFCCLGRQGAIDFLGCVTIDLSKICCEGMDDWFPLRNELGQRTTGEIHVVVSIGATKPINYINSLKRHLLISKLLFERSIEDLNEECMNKIETWEQALHPHGMTLLYQHAIQSNINLYDYSLCRWLALNYLLENGHKLPHNLLYNMLCEVQGKLASQFLHTPLKSYFKEKLTTFNTTCHKQLDILFSPEFLATEESIKNCERISQCISLAENILCLKTDIFGILAQRAVEWYEAEIAVVVEKMQTSPETTSELIVILLNTFQNYHTNIDKVIDNLWPDKNFSQIYKTLWTMICTALKPTIIEMIKKTSQTNDNEVKEQQVGDAVKIIHSLGELWLYAENIYGPFVTDNLDTYRKWFDINIVEEWFQYKEQLVLKTIPKYINTDHFRITNNIEDSNSGKISSSAIKTMKIIKEDLFQLWSMLYWPGSTIEIFYAESVHRCCLKYSAILLQEIVKRALKKSYEEDGRKKLAVLANNIWSLAKFVDLSKMSAHFEDINYPDTKTELFEICSDLCAQISEPRKEVITNLLKEIILTKTYQDQKAAIAKYEAYIARVIWHEAFIDMMFRVFLLFVKEIWDHVTIEITELKNRKKNERCGIIKRVCYSLCGQFNVFSGLLSALTKTEKLVHDEKDCLPIKLINTELYLATSNDLIKLSNETIAKSQTY